MSACRFRSLSDSNWIPGQKLPLINRIVDSILPWSQAGTDGRLAERSRSSWRSPASSDGAFSQGLLADGKSNYGGSWNGVTGSVTGLFYGDSSQLVAQLIGIATLLGFVFTFSFLLNWVLDIFLGQRVSIETEITGLDIPEMGQLGYPEFVLKPEPDFLLAAEMVAVA